MDHDQDLENLPESMDLQEDSELGSIQINHQVVANIVAMTAREVPGVFGLAGGRIKDEIKGFFGSRRESGGGVDVSVDERDRYVIGIKIILVYGVQLARVAQEVQVAVRAQVFNMTSKEVARVNVYIDDVRREEEPTVANDDD